MLHHLIDIASHLNQFEKDPLLRNFVLPMKTKFAKYSNCISMLYSFAFVLDLRAKMRGFHKALTLISNLTSADYANYYESVRARLTTFFTNYDLRFGGQNPHRKQAPLAGAGKKRKAWGKIYGSDAVGVSDPPSTPKPCTPHSSTSTNSFLFESQSELLSCLDSDHVSEYDDDFNILSWWRDHR
jgi:hypothetical protein